MNETHHMQYDVFSDFHLNRYCNLNCSYCYDQSIKKKDPAYRGNDSSTIIKGFNSTGLKWFIHITGGEPFLHPDFACLCEGLSEKHIISVNTNLSTQNIRDFAQRVDPVKVAFVHCSYHLESRKSEKQKKLFINRVSYLRSMGFKVHASQLIYPAIVNHFPELFEELKSEGIILYPKAMKGLYRHRSYPSAYTCEEKSLLFSYAAKSLEHEDADDFFTSFFYRDTEFSASDLSFTGQPCLAGSGFVIVESNGDVTRCMDIRENLGNLFKGSLTLRNGPSPCTAKKCTSARFGLNFCQGRPDHVIANPLRSIIGQVARNTYLGIEKKFERILHGRIKQQSV